MTPQLAGISIYPIKSLDGVRVSQARVLPSGTLENDRRYMLVDAADAVIHAKRMPSIHRIRAHFDPTHHTVRLSTDMRPAAEFHFDSDRANLEAWLSEHFALPVRMIENTTTGFPDDLDSPGPTVVSTASLEAVADWFALPVDEVRRRFRANLEIEHTEPFWEDQLFGEVGADHRLQIGGVVLRGTNPCQRCPVPSRDSLTGDATPGFAHAFADQRLRLLPDWATRTRFDHGYRLATNTRCEVAGSLHLGDAVQVLPI